eukprot:gb/GECH01011105.1/.p1 GENE.gb/GECH01011105.1/~~gb/GECH01011105.1/.p1  ORF type:complete len:145 (+),score=41.46 gb/GECH01011105.1/:1-435(+)
MADEGEKTFVEASNIKKGQYCMIKDAPCKVNETKKSKVGKHGSAKVVLIGFDIFTGKRHESVQPGHSRLEVPIVNRDEFELVYITDDDYAAVMDGVDEKLVPLPSDEELANKIREAADGGDPHLVAVISALGQEAVTGVRTAPQ